MHPLRAVVLDDARLRERVEDDLAAAAVCTPPAERKSEG